MEIWASLRQRASAGACLCMQGSDNLDVTAEACVVAAWDRPRSNFHISRAAADKRLPGSTVREVEWQN